MAPINQATLRKGDVLLNEKHHTAIYLGGGMLVHASINEKGTTTGGKSGDQTGREICTRSYYNYPWDLVLRYPDASLAAEAADKAVAIANDPSHGYDQINRWGPNYDCSSLVISVFESVGVPVRAKGATYTGNMKAVFKKCGFVEVDTEQSGSIMCTVTLPELSKGSKGITVKNLQQFLNVRGYSCGMVDGDFGNKTKMAVVKFQKTFSLTQDGIVGRKTWDALLNK